MFKSLILLQALGTLQGAPREDNFRVIYRNQKDG